MSLSKRELRRFLLPDVSRVEMGDSGRQGDREAGKARRVEEAEKGLAGKRLDCLFSIMAYYIMDVKSALAETVRKSFGNCGLGPLRGCGRDAIFCGISSFAGLKEGRLRRTGGGGSVVLAGGIRVGVAPTALAVPLPHFPALPDWANFCRAYGAPENSPELKGSPAMEWVPPWEKGKMPAYAMSPLRPGRPR